MDVYTAATTLRQQLIALQNSDSTVTKLDQEMSSLNQQCLSSAMEDNQSHHLRLLLRLSVNEGVHNMYQQYSTSKWQQVQNTARSIKSSLEPNNSDETESTMTSPPGGSTRQDQSAGIWTTVFCELSRDE